MNTILYNTSPDFWDRQDIEGVQRINGLLINESPFSYIRIGEGETTFLAKEEDQTELQKRFKYYFGCKPYRYNCLLYHMRKAVQNADLVTLLVRPISVQLAESPLLRRWQKVTSCTESLVPHNRIHYGFRTNYFLHLTGFVYEWIQKHPTFIIGCYPQIRTSLSSLFSKDIGYVQIPRRSIDVLFKDTKHWNTHFIQVLKEIKKIPPYSLVLIGGGPLGKIYATFVKMNGSYAIDCGALFDAWVDFFSRPFHLLTKDKNKVSEGRFSSGCRVNKNLHLTASNIRRFTKNRVSVKESPPVFFDEERVSTGISLINILNGTL